MADKSKETHTEHTTTEVSEVQDFGGGETQSIEPIAEVHHEYHHYSGGQIVERTTTTVSPILWVFWTITILVIIGVVLGTGSIYGFHPGGNYATPGPLSSTYRPQIAAEMSTEVPETFDATTQHSMIAMASLPRPDGQSLTAGIKAGEDTYTTYCIGCHGPNQDGTGPNSTSLDPKPRNLRNGAFMQALSYERINTSVHKGVPGTAMPRWESQLSDDQIKDVILYVFSLTAPTDAKGNFVTEQQIQAMMTNPPAETTPELSPSGNVSTKGVNNTAPAAPSTSTNAPDGASAPARTTTSATAMTQPPAPTSPPAGKFGANPDVSRRTIPPTPAKQ